MQATAATTSLRNHNVSLVAASPTRNPGPLHCSDEQKSQREKQRAFMVAFRDSSPSTSHRLWQRVLFHSSVSVCLPLSRIPLPKWLRMGISEAAPRSASVHTLRLSRTTLEPHMHNFLHFFSSACARTCSVLGLSKPQLHTEQHLTKMFSKCNPLLITFACTAVLSLSLSPFLSISLCV